MPKPAHSAVSFLRRTTPLVTAATLLASLAACGGGSGGYGGGGGNMPVFGVGPSKVFAADSGNKAIGSLANPDPGAGSIAIDRTIVGNVYTQLSNNIGSLALDPVLDYLYVGNGASILVFNGASMANGDVSPSRTISSNPGFSNTGSMFLDTTHNVLYVGDDLAGVRVFNGISGLATGVQAPSRSVTGNFGTTFLIRGVAVDTTARDILYVSNDMTSPATSHQILVFDSASTVTTAAPNRTITPTDSATHTLNFTVGGIAVDATRDLLYVGGGTVTFGVMVFSNASMASGMIAPDKIFNIPGVIAKVVIDPVADRLYAINSSFIYIIDNASTALGSVAAKAVQAPALGSFTAFAVNP
jgi:hypothetical protein